jgi:hypothetical protein
VTLTHVSAARLASPLRLSVNSWWLTWLIRLTMFASLLGPVTGCVTSDHPTSDPEAAVVDEALLGEWQHSKDGSSIHFGRAIGEHFPQGMMSLTFSPPKGESKPIEGYCWASKHGDHLFLNVPCRITPSTDRVDLLDLSDPDTFRAWRTAEHPTVMLHWIALKDDSLELKTVGGRVHLTRQPEELREQLTKAPEKVFKANGGVQTYVKQAPPPAPEWFVENVESPTAPAVALLLGDDSLGYVERGYKGVKLGDSFQDINAATPLRVHPHGDPFVYRDANGSGYVFTHDGKLVCHHRAYQGGPDDYLDQFKELFGTTDRPIVTREQSMGTSAVSRTYIRYTFPKTLAMIEFARGVALTGGRARQTEATHVFVLDREWAEDLLKRSGDAKERPLLWARQASQQVQIGAVEPESLLRIPDTRTKKIRDGAGVIYIDEKKEKQLTEQGYGGDALEQMATVARYVRRDDSNAGSVTFTFSRYSGCDVASFLKQEDNEASKKRGRAYAVKDTPFLTFLDAELTSILVQREFRPRTEEISFVQRQRLAGTVGSGWYEWKHISDGNNAWTVRCGVEGWLELEYLGDRGL